MQCHQVSHTLSEGGLASTRLASIQLSTVTEVSVILNAPSLVATSASGSPPVASAARDQQTPPDRPRYSAGEHTEARRVPRRQTAKSATAVWVGVAFTLLVTARTAQGQSAAYSNQEDQDYSRCAANCFTVVKTISTVPYYSKGASRSVSLVYNGDRLNPRPFFLADMSLPAVLAVPQATSSCGCRSMVR